MGKPLGSAATGAATGAAFGGPAGALIGGGLGLIGGLGGLLGGAQQNRNINRAMDTVRGVKGAAQGQLADIQGGLQSAYSPYTANAGQDMAGLRGLMSQDVQTYQPGDPFQFDTSAHVREFMDPSVDYQVRTATNAVEGSAANRGNLFSSATAKGIADRSQDIAQQSYKDALAAALQQQGLEAQQYQAGEQNKQVAAGQEIDLYGNRLQGQQGLANMGLQASTNLADQLSQAKQNAFQTQNNADLTLAGLMQGKAPTGLAGFMQGVGGSAKGIASLLEAMK